MKWLLVTTIGKNPGDEFIRVGVKKLIESVDPSPEYILIDKECPEQWEKPVAFDKAIWCGMPVFWSIKGNSCFHINWAKLMLGWVSERKNDFMVMGAGSFAKWGWEMETLYRPDEMRDYARRIVERSYKVIARDPVVSRLTGIGIQTLVCPAIFGVKDRPKKPGLNLVNLMPDGAHYRTFGQKEAQAWNGIKNDIGRFFRDAGWTFIAHSDAEYGFARKLGWRESDILRFSNANVTNCVEMLGWYARADRYFGNRVHGAIASRGNGADVFSVGYDSRQEAVKMAGAAAFRPSELTMDKVLSWAADRVDSPYDFESAFRIQSRIVEDFMKA